MLTSVTLPLPESTLSRATPLPVWWRLRASYGYSGLGAKIATAFAPVMDIVPVTPCGALTGPVGRLVFGGGGFSSWHSGATSGTGGGSWIGISSGGGVG